MPSNNSIEQQPWFNALALMRIPFSVFLMPVYWFALSDKYVIANFDIIKAIIVFVVLHILVYPASNGYNSYCDKDEDSVGGLAKPPKVTKELLLVVCMFDLASVLLALVISWQFALMVFVYLMVSKAYSYDKIRLKKYPIISSMIVAFFQGAWVYLSIIQVFTNSFKFDNYSLIFAVVSSIFLLGSYPITQIYQHQSDKKRGDKTLSIVLGLWGTFVFSGVVFFLATIIYVLANYKYGQYFQIGTYLIFTGPILWYLTNWIKNAQKNLSQINHQNTMTMNKISSLSMSFIFFVNMVYGFWIMQ